MDPSAAAPDRPPGVGRLKQGSARGGLGLRRGRGVRGAPGPRGLLAGTRSAGPRPAHNLGEWMRYTPRFPKDPWEIWVCISSTPPSCVHAYSRRSDTLLPWRYVGYETEALHPGSALQRGVVAGGRGPKN